MRKSRRGSIVLFPLLAASVVVAFLMSLLAIRGPARPVSAPAVISSFFQASQPLRVFGPETFGRDRGKPLRIVRTFMVSHTLTNDFILKVQNGTIRKALDRVTSVSSSLNGVQILSPNEFNQNTATLSKPIVLQRENTLIIELHGKLDAFLVLATEVDLTRAFNELAEFLNAAIIEFPTTEANSEFGFPLENMPPELLLALQNLAPANSFLFLPLLSVTPFSFPLPVIVLPSQNNTAVQQGAAALFDFIEGRDIRVDDLRSALSQNETHQEGVKAGGLLLDPGTDAIFFKVPATFSRFSDLGIVVFLDSITHIIFHEPEIQTLLARDFTGGRLSLTPSANTVLHEYLHAMIFRSGCFQGSISTEETLVELGLLRAIDGELTGIGSILANGQQESIFLGGSACLDLLGLSPTPPPLELSFSRTDISTGAFPLGITSADFNGDGKLDLAVLTSAFAGSSSARIFVLLGDGMGGFILSPDFATGFASIWLTNGDLNLDRRPDVVVANGFSGSVSFFQGIGDGTFGARTDLFTAGRTESVITAIAADFNLDGKPDLAATNFEPAPYSVSVFLGDGMGGFGPRNDFLTLPVPFVVIKDDFNADGKPDLAINGHFGGVSVLLGNGDGTFQPKKDSPTGFFQSSSLVAGDINGDGKSDIAVTNNADNSVSILLGNGDGTFNLQPPLATDLTPFRVLMGDFNADGILDVAVGIRNSAEVSIFLGNGDATFHPKMDFQTGAGVQGLVAQDFNGDGKLDLVTANFDAGTISILLNTSR